MMHSLAARKHILTQIYQSKGAESERGTGAGGGCTQGVFLFTVNVMSWAVSDLQLIGTVSGSGF